MPIDFSCTKCARAVRVPDRSEGKKCQCPGCQAILVVPTAVVPDIEVVNIDIKLEVPCPRCDHVLLCDPALEGTRGMCPSCRLIFTITPPNGEPTQAPGLLQLTFPFQCPHCKQLFEGKPGMEGRKGKCIGCHQVFQIVRQ